MSFLCIDPVGCFKYAGVAAIVDFWDKCLEIRVDFFNLYQVEFLKKKRISQMKILNKNYIYMNIWYLNEMIWCTANKNWNWLYSR